MLIQKESRTVARSIVSRIKETKQVLSINGCVRAFPKLDFNSRRSMNAGNKKFRMAKLIDGIT